MLLKTLMLLTTCLWYISSRPAVSFLSFLMWGGDLGITRVAASMMKSVNEWASCSIESVREVESVFAVSSANSCQLALLCSHFWGMAVCVWLLFMAVRMMGK